MARTRKHKRRTSHNAGRRHSRHNRSMKMVRHHARRHRGNPAGYRWGDILALGGGGLAGGAGSIAIPQLVLGSANTGAMGYIANLVSTFILAWVGHSFVRNKAFSAGVLAGGVGALMRRVISDYSLLGSYQSTLGLGDYMASNWVTPQRLSSDWRSLTQAQMQIPDGWGTTPPAVAVSSQGISVNGLGLEGSQAAAGYLMGGSLGY